MNSMFNKCTSLSSLDLSNFETSNVVDMSYMFSEYSSLTSLNLSNFVTYVNIDMNNMFNNCEKLEYINMINFKDLDSRFWQDDMFKNVPENVVLCINKTNIKKKIYPQIERISCHIEDCTNDWKLKQNQLNIEITKDTYISPDNIQYKYEHDGKCSSICFYGEIYDDKNNIKCRCEFEKCLTCPREAFNNQLCSKCNSNYYKIENDPLNIGDYFNCYNEAPKGYFFDESDSMYKKCYDTCETCEIKGNNESHKCLKCDVEFSFEIQVNNYTNCYKKCPQNNYYFDDNNVYHCNESLSFNSEYPQITNEEIEFITRDIKYIQNVIDSLLYFEKNETKNEIENDDEINNYKRILEEIESIFISDNFESAKIDEVKEQELKANKLIISFSNYENQKNNKNNNVSTIDLENCENLIRIHYNLTNNETIYMIKININPDKKKTKKSLFNIYSKISDKKLEKLNISLCENSKIFIYVPIEINDNIVKLILVVDILMIYVILQLQAMVLIYH